VLGEVEDRVRQRQPTRRGWCGRRARIFGPTPSTGVLSESTVAVGRRSSN